MKRLVLPCVLLLVLGMIYVLPRRGAVAQASVTMRLPMLVDEWQGVRRPPSEEEVRTLDAETEFEKADYFRTKRSPTGILAERQDVINTSIVLSGVDLNNSIHRPERCLPGQGHFGILGADDSITLHDGRTIRVRKLVTKQIVRLNSGKEVVLDALIYYFFVGHHQITHSHTQRTLLDMGDRLFGGFDQRWAYVTVSTRFGDVVELGLETTQAEAEVYLKDFFRDVVGQIVDLDSIPR